MNYESIKLFVLDDDVIFSKTMEIFLEKHGFTDIHLFESSAPMFDRMHEKPKVLILDHFIKTEIGLDILKRVRAEHPEIMVIYVSNQKKANTAIQALRMGASAYLEKTLEDMNTLIKLIEDEFQLSRDIYLHGSARDGTEEE